jgi:glycosyltransferase involved in cell wall biosynthesis
MDISVVVPVYNSAATLNELHGRLIAALDGAVSNFEIILVDDCSRDDSWIHILALVSADPRVRGIRLTRNFGQHAATLCGISKTNGSWILTIDDDLQQKPEDIGLLLAKKSEKVDLIYGYSKATAHSAFRRITSEIVRKLFALSIPNLFPYCSSFRLIRGGIARSLEQFESPYPFVDGFLSWITYRYALVEVGHADRGHGLSNYNFRKLFVTAANIFFTFSDLPLKFSSWIGMVAFIFGMLLLLLILVIKVTLGIPVMGYASVMAVILMLGGLQLLILGVFGEYLGRMNFGISKKPMFAVAEVIDVESGRHT